MKRITNKEALLATAVIITIATPVIALVAEVNAVKDLTRELRLARLAEMDCRYISPYDMVCKDERNKARRELERLQSLTPTPTTVTATRP